MFVALRLDGLMYTVSMYWVFHENVMVLGPFIATALVDPVPDAEPEYPVQTYLVPELPETGVFTEYDAVLPLSYQPAPTGEPRVELKLSRYCVLRFAVTVDWVLGTV
jgi:hypothetical protein